MFALQAQNRIGARRKNLRRQGIKFTHQRGIFQSHLEESPRPGEIVRWRPLQSRRSQSLRSTTKTV